MRLPPNSSRVPICCSSRCWIRVVAGDWRSPSRSVIGKPNQDGLAVRRRLRQDQDILERRQHLGQQVEIALAGGDEAVEPVELREADRGLHVGDLQIVAEVAVGVLVVVAHRQVAELPAEALAAGVVLARRALAVAAPVADRFDRSA